MAKTIKVTIILKNGIIKSEEMPYTKSLDKSTQHDICVVSDSFINGLRGQFTFGHTVFRMDDISTITGEIVEEKIEVFANNELVMAFPKDLPETSDGPLRYGNNDRLLIECPKCSCGYYLPENNFENLKKGKTNSVCPRCDFVHVLCDDGEGFYYESSH